MTRRLAVLLCAVLFVAGCGSEDESGSGGYGKPRLTVSAAASLKRAFEAYGKEFTATGAKFSFAGSYDLAAQIRQGVRPDVFASANTKLPDEPYDEGLVEQPRVFAGNRLVLAVPAEDAKVSRLEDLYQDGIATLAMGDEEVPVGSYTREVIGKLGWGDNEQAVLGNVKSVRA